MATTDKTYANQQQYQIAVQFLKTNKERMLQELGEEIKPYSDENYRVEWGSNPEKTFPLWNTSFIKDVWLYKNCDLQFVQNRLKEQYGENCEKLSFFAKICDFSLPFVHLDRIYNYDDDISISFSFEKNGLEYIFDENDEVVSFGDAYILEVLNFAVQSLTNRKPSSNLSKNIVVEFNYYGAIMKFESGVFYYYDLDGVYEWEEIEGFGDILTTLEPYLKVPKVEITLDTNKLQNYDPEKIFFSDSYKEGGFVKSWSEYRSYEENSKEDLCWLIKKGYFHKSEHLLKFFR